ncbi:hypothetical protein [Proteiniclasticum ruminis]|uniref:dTDP-4-amino-4,6-dideoxygalactose transaminase n=1 Tax=Proteiniclasticum ruminis TaxID=398199 RepID=A0A1G8SCU7_9CLOT|nr:hypothetical protein [Proteiniclasticum ruminis]SDJ26994.1 dTDP-4-amino-4,6-dideoxygalactose transaminase [Proteiniclasticum ruminis]
MSIEIGSEFWKVDKIKGIKSIQEEKQKILLTGRTSLDYIIKDIKIKNHFNSVYLPSYCCHTMIQPFIDNGITVEFYDISFKDGRFTYCIDFDTKCDAILIMQYFGYSNVEVEQIIETFKEKKKIVIEDATHSWFSENRYSLKSDYVFASLRKWTGLACGSIVMKSYDDFHAPFPSITNEKYVGIRKKAANLKKQYIEAGKGTKEVFLNMFDEAERLLEEDYIDYTVPDSVTHLISCLDFEKIRKRRKQNATVLIKGLKGNIGIDCVKVDNDDVPLFVPIIVLNGKRDKLRQHLINKNIYCPVHWQVSKLHTIHDKYIYDNCLSLICDQRYSVQDMKTIINTINEFYRKEIPNELY